MLERILPDEYAATTAILILAVAFMVPGCQKDQSWQNPGPADTFERFLLDWYRGEREVAFETIAPEDRERLTEPREKLRDKLSEAQLPAPNEMLVTGRVDNPYDIKRVETIEPLETAPEEGQAVTLKLTYHDGREGTARMLWGGKRWYVDLPLPSENPEEAAATSDDAPAQPKPDAGPATSDDAGVDAERAQDTPSGADATETQDGEQ